MLLELVTETFHILLFLDKKNPNLHKMLYRIVVIMFCPSWYWRTSKNATSELISVL